MSSNFKNLRGSLLVDEPMARHTSWRVGGPARWFYRPSDVDDLAMFLNQLPNDADLIWVGLGSNLLVRDGGVDGAVLCTSGVLGAIEVTGRNSVRAEVGVSCAKLARFCARNELSGGEFLAGIPGTLGGALRMNAGAFGGETWSLVSAVETIDRSGNRYHRDASEYKIGYRHVELPAAEWFLAAHLRFKPDDGGQAAQRIKELLNRRASTQPLSEPSCGSVFRNPPGDHAARLIETSNLKGYRIGGARVSEKHANFIVNDGTASARDIENLIEYVAGQVFARHGVRLQREVHIVGHEAQQAQDSGPAPGHRHESLTGGGTRG